MCSDWLYTIEHDYMNIDKDKFPVLVIQEFIDKLQGIFHVSLLKKCKEVPTVMGHFSHLKDDCLLVLEPIAELDRKL